MFYSHEILTSREHGVATIWLVATLGAKSTLKKVNRKAISEVKVPQACERIMTPNAPMALRLQSHLLYGVVRVYSEQCSYMLVDAQNAQNNMRTLLRTVKVVETEGKHKAKSDLVNLREDSQFILEDLFNMDSELSRDFGPTESSFTDLDSLTSDHDAVSNATDHQQETSSVGGIDIPNSFSSSHRGLDAFSLGGSAYGGTGKLSHFRSSIFKREEDERLVDPGFAFDELGNIIDSISATAVDAVLQPDMGTQRGPSVVVGDSTTETQPAVAVQHRTDEDDFLPPFQEDYDTNTAIEPFPTRPLQTALLSSTHIDQNSHNVNRLAQSSETVVEEVVNVPALRGKKRKVIELDLEQELHNHDLSAWNENYLMHMDEVLRGKMKARSGILARSNANFWVLENGVGGLIAALGREAIPGPLRMFTGHALLEALTGHPIYATGSTKRPREEDDGVVDDHADETARRVRARNNEYESGGQDGDIMMDDPPNVGDETGYTGGHVNIEDDEMMVEVGREAHTPLNEHMSSGMPWNNTISIRGSSVRLTGRAHVSTGAIATSSAGGGPFGGLGRPRGRTISRMASDSPSRGRSGLGTTLDPSGEYGAPDIYFHYRENEPFLGGEEGGHPLTTIDQNVNEQYTDLEPEVGMDAQVATHARSDHTTLDSETERFFNWLQANTVAANNTAREATASTKNVDDTMENVSNEDNEVLFEKLLPPGANSRVVAAEGLLHVLTLATKQLLHTVQRSAFGPIKLRVVGAKNSVPDKSVVAIDQ